MALLQVVALTAQRRLALGKRILLLGLARDGGIECPLGGVELGAIGARLRLD
ncbi:MAG: hypothetical protein JOY99_16805 [Sphingomonadaceae bacterium]|nr:hypothetical protein [Sphingomonadaceae bacterium]